MAIKITTSLSSGYRERTIENASAEHLTLAFAIDFTTAGEKLTRSAVRSAHREYLAIQLDEKELSEWSAAHKAANQIIPVIKDLNTGAGIGINIAGNGLTRFSSNVDQQALDVFMTRTLMLVQHKTQGDILRVRSGGQTGIDEAGVKAADALGIPALVNGPADYRLRVRWKQGHHIDVTNEGMFRTRLEDNHIQRKHLEPLSELNRQLNEMTLDTALKLLDGNSVEVTPGNFIEIAENTAGEDRLWYNDDLYSEYIEKESVVAEQAEPVKHKIYYCFNVKYEEYMSDYISSADVYAETLDEAEREIENSKAVHLVTGDHYPDIHEISVKQIIIDGRGYNVNPIDLQEVIDIQKYADNLIKQDPDFLNIFYGTGENPELSNFAIRPFDFLTGEDTSETFQSVEQGFQYMKTLPQFSQMDDNMRSKMQKKILATTNGFALKDLGRIVPNLNCHAWNRASVKLMRDLIWSSFDSNPKAKDLLLSTGNSSFKHIQDKSAWKHTFPAVLQDVRADFQRRLEIKANYNALRITVNNQTVNFYEGDIEPHPNTIFVFGSVCKD